MPAREKRGARGGRAEHALRSPVQRLHLAFLPIVRRGASLVVAGARAREVAAVRVWPLASLAARRALG